ncbi:MAG: cytochrome c biogenesis protein CcsA [Methylococcaceae bacterium]|nr:cytochrome c biogenesis protein CcsA [Prolixibacteraceae bacterium]
MKKIFSFFFSMLFSVILLMLFAIAIAYATFIENDYGTATAQALIYQAWWFELLLLIGAINLAGSVVKYKLVNRKKWAILLFHLAFIVIIIGAGITRYFGFEGSMHIREGASSNQIISEATYITVKADANGKEVNSTTQVKFTPNTSNSYKKTLDIDGKSVTVENELFVPYATETLVPDANGTPIISLIYSDPNTQRLDLLLAEKDKKEFGSFSVGFNTGEGSASVVFNQNGANLTMIAADTIVVSDMMGHQGEKLSPHVALPVIANQFYTVGNSRFVLKNYLPKATPALVQVSDPNSQGEVDAFTAKVTSGNETRRVNVFGTNGMILSPSTCTINGINLTLSYGSIIRELPFSIQLKDFQLERYPGSMSPSSYASEIVLKDPTTSVEKPFRIFMNNILKYNGYRFFQSSFDKDEQGTVLSVNQDYWGTMITYFGYFLMALGMVFTIFSPGSRFQKVIRLSTKLQQQRKLGKVFLLAVMLSLGAGWNTSAAGATITKEDHIKEFGRLLTQDHEGRIEPVHTLASDLLRKIAKKSDWDGMSPVEFFLDMSANPEKWKNTPLVKVDNKELQKQLGVSTDFVSFSQMFDQSGNYRLNDLVQQSYNKKQTSRNKFDKEIINVDERLNICYQIFNGDFLKIFPVPNDPRKTWVTHSTLPSTMKKSEADFAGSILKMYYDEYNAASISGNWSKPQEYLGYIQKYQTTYGSDIMPSPTKISLEIFYNQFNIFGKLAKTFALLGFILLIFHFMMILKPQAQYSKYIKAGTLLVFLAFLLYTAGLGIRWYISGHAPWSNGYETMIYVGWAAILSGFVFARRSPISLAVTTVLTAIILFVAGMSWMNPEITNLVPVLKSYWLIVHVAIITASYGFLAMGALLGMLNLVLMIIRNPKNEKNIRFTILEVSYIIEMALMVGLLMLTIGSFIGGVWANESWGRYWGWDPKETWALVTVLVYTIILHLRKVPGLKSVIGLSSLALVGLSSVLMTFFGVNYYLSGMHSYGAGDPPPIPSGLYVAIVVVIVLIIAAYNAEGKKGKIEDIEDAETENDIKVKA